MYLHQRNRNTTESTQPKGRNIGGCTMADYRCRTTEELINAYAFEAGRINEEDRKATQRLIKNELKRRFEAMMNLLDDEQTTRNPKGTYNYLLGK